MEINTNQPCNTSTLAPYVPSSSNPWSTKKIKHIYRRLGYGANLATIDSALLQTPGALIDFLVDEATAVDVTPAPPWGNFAVSDFNDLIPKTNSS
jgi:hypothetical protein